MSAKSYAGPAPWSNTPLSTSQLKGSNSWDLSSGWHKPRQKGWTKDTPYTYKKLISPDGTVHKHRYYEVKDYRGFSAHNEGSAKADEALAAAEYAFSQEGHNNVFETDGCGHIAHLRYAQDSNILEVTFENGSKTVYSSIPDEVCFTLLYYAATKVTAGVHARGTSKAGQPRHQLGVAFWDFVRIRGNSGKAKYPFEYAAKIEGKYVNKSNRHDVRISLENALAIFGEEGLPGSGNLRYLLQNPKIKKALAGREVTVFMNDEEYAKWNKELGSMLMEYQAGADRVSTSGENISIRKKASKHDDDPDDLSIDSLENVGVTDQGIENVESGRSRDYSSVHEFSGQGRDPSYNSILAEDLRQIIKDNIDNVRASKAYRDFTNYDWDPDADQASQNKRTLRGISRKTGNLTRKAKEAYTMQELSEFAPKDEAAEKRKKYAKEFAAMYANRYVGLKWSPQMLIDFADPSQPGSISLEHAAAYNYYIKKGDYRGALNFLKNHKHEVEYYRNMNNGNGKNNTKKKFVAYTSKYSSLTED